MYQPKARLSAPGMVILKGPGAYCFKNPDSWAVSRRICQLRPHHLRPKANLGRRRIGLRAVWSLPAWDENRLGVVDDALDRLGYRP